MSNVIITAVGVAALLTTLPVVLWDVLITEPRRPAPPVAAPAPTTRAVLVPGGTVDSGAVIIPGRPA
jgi:hypothetical protein